MEQKTNKKKKTRYETKVIAQFFKKHNLWYYKIPDVWINQKPFDCIAYIKDELLGVKMSGLQAFEFKHKSRKLLKHQVFNLMKARGWIVWWWFDGKLQFKIESIFEYVKREAMKGEKKEETNYQTQVKKEYKKEEEVKW